MIVFDASVIERILNIIFSRVIDDLPQLDAQLPAAISLLFHPLDRREEKTSNFILDYLVKEQQTQKQLSRASERLEKLKNEFSCTKKKFHSMRRGSNWLTNFTRRPQENTRNPLFYFVYVPLKKLRKVFSFFD